MPVRIGTRASPLHLTSLRFGACCGGVGIDFVQARLVQAEPISVSAREPVFQP